MIDLHCHLLPNLDDGPSSTNAALALARAMVADGITHAVATPHIYPGRFDNTLDTIHAAYMDFLPLLQQQGIPLTLSWAAEVRLNSESIARLEHDELPFLGQLGTERVLLLELPDGHIPLGTDKLIAALLANQYRAVIAHPERNKAVMAELQQLKPLVDAGAYLQITAGAVVGQFGPRAQRAALATIEAGWVAAISSDAHNLGGRRPRMSDARELVFHLYGADAARQLFFHGPSMLCATAVPSHHHSPHAAYR